MIDEQKKAIEKALRVKAVVVEIECDYCQGRKRLPGGKYQAQGEVVPCGLCNGHGVVRSSVSLSTLYDLLMGNIAAVDARRGGGPEEKWLPADTCDKCGGAAYHERGCPERDVALRPARRGGGGEGAKRTFGARCSFCGADGTPTDPLAPMLVCSKCAEAHARRGGGEGAK